MESKTKSGPIPDPSFIMKSPGEQVATPQAGYISINPGRSETPLDE